MRYWRRCVANQWYVFVEFDNQSVYEYEVSPHLLERFEALASHSLGSAVASLLKQDGVPCRCVQAATRKTTESCALTMEPSLFNGYARIRCSCGVTFDAVNVTHVWSHLCSHGFDSETAMAMVTHVLGKAEKES